MDGPGTVDCAAIADGDVFPVTGAATVDVPSENSLRTVAVQGRPHGEPIGHRGPLVLQGCRATAVPCRHAS
ncbi:hypothetical protein BRD22_10805 [Halobacteriales archaeon SW_8_68_21]|nr:MAG: hypothetical protein BRD22_10805 [Halobacteriales archaeon SW_8_68_21]